MANTKQKQKTIVKPIQENKYIVWVLLASLLICIFALSSYKIDDDDVFWHLATGRFVVENGYVPDKDVFGALTQNTEWIPFEWGWDVISYELYNTGGYNAIFIFRSLIFCLIFFIYFRLLKKFNVNSVISAVLLFILLMAVNDRLSPRPHMFTYLFFVVLLYLFTTFKYIDREKYFKRLFSLPLIFLLWGNLHLGVIAGGLLLFIFTLSEVIIYYYPSRFSNSENKALSREQLKKLAIISIASALVLLINPHGIQTYIYAYSHTKMKMLESILEWQNPFTGKIEMTFVVTLYKIFLFTGIIVLIYAYKKRDLTAAMIYLAFAVYSVRAIRFTVDYEIVIVFFIAVCVDYYLKHFIKSNSFSDKLLNGNITKVVFAVFFIYVSSQALSDNLYIALKYNKQSGWGINEEYIPVALFNFIKENNINGTPFNNFESGGYLIWNSPGQKNFIDSRNINDEIFNEYMSILYMNPGFENKLEKDGVDYVIYFEPKLAKYPNNLKKSITEFLFKNKNWKLLYWDDKSMLFLKDIPKNAELISKYEYRVFNPYNALFNKKEFETAIANLPDIAVKEINRKAASEPRGYFYLGMNDMAQKILNGKH